MDMLFCERSVTIAGDVRWAVCLSVLRWLLMVGLAAAARGSPWCGVIFFIFLLDRTRSL